MANQLSIKQCQLHHQRIQEAESTQVINDVLLEPSDFLSRVRRFSPAVILAIIYGKRGPRWESKEIQDIYVVMQAWSRIMETGNTPPIDIWPFLKYLPDFMSEWRARAKKLSGNMFTLYHSLVDEVRERRKRGIVRDCLMDKILEEQEAPGFDKSTALSDDKLAFLGGVLMEGGSDTVYPPSTLMLIVIDSESVGEFHVGHDEISSRP
jgi:cytochrome P450 family 619